MATHSSVLAWRIPGMGKPGGLPSMGLHRVGHDWSDLAAAAIFSKNCHFISHCEKELNGLCFFSHREALSRVLKIQQQTRKSPSSEGAYILAWGGHKQTVITYDAFYGKHCLRRGLNRFQIICPNYLFWFLVLI